MSKRELSIDEQESIDKIIEILTGYNLEQAEVILKAVAALIKERAVIE